jgi:excinuclease ABC subunit A
MDTILYGTNEVIHVKNEYLGVSSTYSLNFEGVINFILSQSNEASSASIRKWAGNFMNKVTCPVCRGHRLKIESLHFRIDGKNISELAGMELLELKNHIDTLKDKLEERKQRIANEILREISTRIRFLLEVGLDYITLNRSARSLSGGESQRIRLATQIGSQLTGVLYILD